MPERDGYIPGVPCWVDTIQPDPRAAAAFYGALFGWEIGGAVPGAPADGGYLIGRIRGGDVAGILPPPESAPRAAMWNTYIWVASADETAAAVRAAGGAVLREPFDVTGAGRVAVLADPEGAVFCLWEAKAHKGARVVNEHGSLNFNVLATRDVARAEAFYGAVFGWKLLDLPDEPMWMLPGYGDHLEERSPGLRAQMVEMGAPDGFVDVVASVNPLAADDRETAAHWGVVFAVDDADAAAARARELGASVLAGPFDAPWVRMAVIADPQGAAFTVSQFVPENRDLAR